LILPARYSSLFRGFSFSVFLGWEERMREDRRNEESEGGEVGQPSKNSFFWGGKEGVMGGKK